MLAKYTNILIRRDMAETLSPTLFEHELEILRDIHGEGNISVASTDFPAVEIDAGEEYDRLRLVYGSNDSGQLYVERCIGRGPKQLEALAFKPARTRAQKAPAEEVDE